MSGLASSTASSTVSSTVGSTVGVGGGGAGIQPGLSYTSLAGTPPSILRRSWRTWATRLKDKRLANIPLERTTKYYFSEAGDDANVGSLASPWQTLARASEIASPLAGNRIAGNEHTVADSTQFHIDGRSFWMGGWVRGTGSNYYGPIFTINGSYALVTGTTDETPRMYANDLNLRAQWTANVGGTDSDWHFIECWYDHTTLQIGLSVDGGTPVLNTLGSQFPSGGASTLEVGQGGYATGEILGDMARLFFVRDFVPTDTQRAAMYNEGRGLRSYLLPADIKAAFVANSGAFWDLAGENGTTTYADAISGNTLTRVVAQNSVPITGPDDDAAVSSSNLLGADIALLFNRGDRFEGSFAIERPGIVAADYGSGAKPVFSMFTVPISGTWTLVAGTTYKLALATRVGWVKKAGDDYLPFDLVLAKAEDGADCQATANSFWYDDTNDELHLNVGGDPSTVSPAGWEGTVASLAGVNSYSATGDFQRMENLILLGSGITEPGSTSGYGLQVTGTALQEFVGVGLQVFYTGYHAIGQITTSGICTLVDCDAGLCSSRNQSGELTNPAEGTVYVSYDGNGGQEWLSWDCGVSHGALPSYDYTDNSNMGGMLAHGDGANDRPALMLCYGTAYPDTDFPVGYGTQVGGVDAADWSDLRSWIVDETISESYLSSFGLIGNSAPVAVVNSRGGTAVPYGPGYALAVNNRRLLNCTLYVDVAGNAGGFNIFGNFATSMAVKAIGCRFDVANSTGTVAFVEAAKTFDGDLKNCIVTRSGAGSSILGSADAADFENCAFFGFTAVGTDSVALGSSPSLTTAPATSSDLFAAGQSGLIEYDEANAQRATVPTIGPFEAA